MTVTVSDSENVDISVMHINPAQRCLCAARPALAGLAVPSHRQIADLLGLQSVDDVEHDLAFVHSDVEVDQVPARVVAAPQSCHSRGTQEGLRQRRPVSSRIRPPSVRFDKRHRSVARSQSANRPWSG